MLKTTQSGYEGFLKDEYTALKDTNVSWGEGRGRGCLFDRCLTAV